MTIHRLLPCLVLFAVSRTLHAEPLSEAAEPMGTASSASQAPTVDDGLRPASDTVPPPQQASSPPSSLRLEPVAELPPGRHWYGWQTLSADGAAIGLLALSLANTESSAGGPIAIVGIGTYLVGGPTVHLAHGHVGKAFGSLGLRVGLPVGGALLATAIAKPCGGDFGCLGEAGLGTLLGMATAIVLDATVLAHEDRAPVTQSVGTAPLLVVDSQHVLAGVRGSF